ncbi:D-alanyl-D-alanine carboxypeptidase, partial [bacterium]|nr:D-alanyl-D-alanine carboxypeptidase [bacterium]
MIRSALVSLLVLAPQLPVRAARPMLAPPPVVQRQGQAMLSGGALCPALQTALESAVGTEERLWSVSV